MVLLGVYAMANMPSKLSLRRSGQSVGSVIRLIVQLLFKGWFILWPI